MEKYVNMADIISAQELGEAETTALIELLFFAYRDFVSDPDAILEEFGFGRAHHRVIHFVGRDPGMTVQQLLDILRITKQSLGRVLKELIDKGYVFQKEGRSRPSAAAAPPHGGRRGAAPASHGSRRSPASAGRSRSRMRMQPMSTAWSSTTWSVRKTATVCATGSIV